MPAIIARLFRCMLLLFMIVRSQDMKAVAEDGRTVMLKSSGVWFYIDRSERTDSWATLRDSTKVQLNKDGTWIKTSSKAPIPDQSQYISRLPGKKTGPPGTPFKNTQFRYSIIPPKGWSMEKSNPEDLQWKLLPVVPKKKITANNYINVTTTKLHNGETLTDFVDSFLKMLTETGFTIEGKGTSTVGGKTAQWFTGTLHMMDLQYTTKTYMLVNGALGYEISYSSGVEEFPAHLDLFEETIHSFTCE